MTASAATRGERPPPWDTPREAVLSAGWWHCWGCRKTLGALAAGRVVIRHGALHLRAALPTDRMCERCGTWNRLTAE